MSQYYLGVQIVEGFPHENNGMPGYSLRYSDDSCSWVSKSYFESVYLSMGDNNDSKVILEMVDKFLTECESYQIDTNNSVIKGKTLTGVTHYESSASFDSHKYDQETREDYAKLRIISKIYELLGFVVQWGRFGLTGNNK